MCDRIAGSQHNGYLCCGECGHQWKCEVPIIEIENEILSVAAATKPDLLTMFKLRAVERLTLARGSLLDFGAGSGKYAFFCRRRFARTEGVEVTQSCIAFARDTLGILLRPRLEEGARYDVVTLWHSLEHLPPDSLRPTIVKLYAAANEALIVSVPNTGSWASRWFGVLYPFYDPESHFQQFSNQSLRELLSRAGWVHIVPFHVGIYSVFCYAQGFTNWITCTRNLLYFRLKRGQGHASLSGPRFFLHAGLFVMFLPLALILAALERFALHRGACLHFVCYKTEPSRRRRP